MPLRIKLSMSTNSVRELMRCHEELDNILRTLVVLTKDPVEE
jgi:hypothetical protein